MPKAIDHDLIFEDIINYKAIRIDQLVAKKGRKKTVPFITAECVKRSRGKGDRETFIKYAKEYLGVE